MNSEKPAKSIITFITTDLSVLGANVLRIMISNFCLSRKNPSIYNIRAEKLQMRIGIFCPKVLPTVQHFRMAVQYAIFPFNFCYVQGYNIDDIGFDFECETFFLPAAQRHGLTMAHFLHFLGAFNSDFSSLTYQTTHQFKASSIPV